MFSQVFVCPRGREWLHSMHYRSHDQHPEGSSSWGLPPGGSASRGVCLRWGGSASRGDLHWGVLDRFPPSPPELEKQVNASYWNAFLFYFIQYVQSRKKTSTRSLIQPWELKRTLHDCQVLGNWTNAHLDSVLLFIVSLSDRLGDFVRKTEK